MQTRILQSLINRGADTIHGKEAMIRFCINRAKANTNLKTKTEFYNLADKCRKELTKLVEIQRALKKEMSIKVYFNSVTKVVNTTYD